MSCVATRMMALGCVLACALPAGAASLGRIVAVQGGCLLRCTLPGQGETPAAGQEVPGRVNVDLEEGTWITTDWESKVKAVLAGDVILTLGADTVVGLASSSGGPTGDDAPPSIYLQSGMLRVLVERPFREGNPLLIGTPDGTIRVTGSHLVVHRGGAIPFICGEGRGEGTEVVQIEGHSVNRPAGEGQAIQTGPGETVLMTSGRAIGPCEASASRRHELVHATRMGYTPPPPGIDFQSDFLSFLRLPGVLRVPDVPDVEPSPGPGGGQLPPSGGGPQEPGGGEVPVVPVPSGGGQTILAPVGNPGGGPGNGNGPPTGGAGPGNGPPSPLPGVHNGPPPGVDNKVLPNGKTPGPPMSPPGPPDHSHAGGN